MHKLHVAFSAGATLTLVMNIFSRSTGSSIFWFIFGFFFIGSVFLIVSNIFSGNGVNAEFWFIFTLFLLVVLFFSGYRYFIGIFSKNIGSVLFWIFTIISFVIFIIYGTVFDRLYQSYRDHSNYLSDDSRLIILFELPIILFHLVFYFFYWFFGKDTTKYNKLEHLIAKLIIISGVLFPFISLQILVN